jgi:hypothetical protein
MFEWGHQDNFNYLIFEKLGRSLDDLLALSYWKY